ncbi:cyclin-C [Sclerotinia borealis F-4128]|uniref:RNA polymerase II holoenzyme cyclin-like subunit n=1 Tax=Sclerotinia borealis (strain F-4128) TaxID=1432307 RepID=W9CL68_SCLBF|nr:cyclin-C [Sclerotinia borealis F-4128]
MAANYWESSQRKHWQFTREQLEDLRSKLEDEDQALVQAYPLPQLRHLSIYFNQQMTRLGKRLGVRQQAMATAQLYIRRFYSKVEIRKTNPYLVLATAVYLACKMEECPHHIRLVVSEGRGLWPGMFSSNFNSGYYDQRNWLTIVEYFSNDTSRLGECEFFLISEMSSQMIVHHPYRSLTALQGTFSLTAEESNLAWSIVNDHYMTDLPLFYAPHTIAIMAILLALVLRPNATGIQSASGSSASNIASAAQAALATAGQAKGGTPEKQGGRTKVQRLASWLAESTIDIEAIVDCTQEMISFYEAQEQYNEKLTREQINRFIKARGLDK